MTTQENHTEEVREFLQFVNSPNHLVEIRGLGSKEGVLRHLHTDASVLARSAKAIEARGASVFYSLNPVDPASPYASRHTTAIPSLHVKKTARDKDMLHRALYLVDVDPIRPSGVASTDEEKAAAYATATAVQHYLSGKGWPEPIVVDSGNGYHLIYRGDQTAATSDAWTYVLRELATMFDDEHASVDTSVHNAARVSRLPGTLNAKGTATEDRPHRRATVLRYPDEWQPVSHSLQVYALAKELGISSAKAITSRQSAPKLLIDDEGVYKLAAEYPEHLSIAYTKELDDMTLYILDSCPFAGRPHTGSSDKTALTLSSTSLGFRCLSSDCDGKGWRDLKVELYRRTGRWPKQRIYKHPDSETMPDCVYQAEHRLKQTVEWKWDAETHCIIASEDFQSRQWPTDPSAWNLTWDQIRHHLYSTLKADLQTVDTSDQTALDQQFDRLYRARDMAWAGKLLGAECLFILRRHLDRPETPEEWRFVSNAEWDRLERVRLANETYDLDSFSKSASWLIDWAHGDAGYAEAGIRGFC